MEAESSCISGIEFTKRTNFKGSADKVWKASLEKNKQNKTGFQPKVDMHFLLSNKYLNTSQTQPASNEARWLKGQSVASFREGFPGLSGFGT